MALTRKPRRVGHSWVVGVPRDVAAMIDLQSASAVEYQVIGSDQLLLRLVRRSPAPPP
jgi:antitoxin component of MazEF toxin-antitoxin module